MRAGVDPKRGGMAKRQDAAASRADRLPKGKDGPYYTWYKFVVLAIEAKALGLDSKHYLGWDLEHLGHKEWFAKNWERLFAPPPAVTELNDLSKVSEALSAPEALVVRISLGEPKKKIEEQLSALIDDAVRKNGIQTRTGAGAKYKIQSGRSVPWDHLKFLGNFYARYLHSGRILEIAAIEYCHEARSINAAFKMAGFPEKQLLIPSVLINFKDQVCAGGEPARGVSGSGRLSKAAAGDAQSQRDQVVRYIKQAENIIANVANGIFPGKY